MQVVPTKLAQRMARVIVMGSVLEMSNLLRVWQTSKIGRSTPTIRITTAVLVLWGLAAQRWICGKPTPWPLLTQLTPAQRKVNTFVMVIQNAAPKMVTGTLRQLTEMVATSTLTVWATQISMVLGVRMQWTPRRSSQW
jgi:hypothetical protein